MTKETEKSTIILRFEPTAGFSMGWYYGRKAVVARLRHLEDYYRGPGERGMFQSTYYSYMDAP